MSRVPLLWVSSLPHSCRMVQISQSCIWKLFSIDLYNITISRMLCFGFASSLLGTYIVFAFFVQTTCSHFSGTDLFFNILLCYFERLRPSLWIFFELLRIIATVNYAAFVLCKSSVLSWSINKTSAIWRQKYYATANHFPGMLFSLIFLSSTLQCTAAISTLLLFPHCCNEPCNAARE